jgi:sterol desaturase/sphingolipid hydroxylase (fatty acid hydroxylase superfamily)
VSIFNPKNLKEQLLHDAGHALTAVIVIVVLSLLGVATTWAFVLGCFGAPAVVEVMDYLRSRRFTKDSLHDITNYQLPWLFYAYNGDTLLMGLVILVLVVAAEGLYYWERIEHGFK